MDSTQDWHGSVEVDDDAFQQSLARLSQGIVARRATILMPAPLPVARRRWKGWALLLFIAVVGAAAAGYHYAAFIEGDLLPTKPIAAEGTGAPPAPVLAAVAVAPTPVVATPPEPPASEPGANGPPADGPPTNGPMAASRQPASTAEPVAATPSEPVEASAPVPPVAPAPTITAAPPTVSEPDIALTWAEVLEVQKRLASAGVDPGPLDGVVGPLTTGGVQRYQEQHGVAVTGKADRRLLKLLQQAATAPASLEARAP